MTVRTCASRRQFLKVGILGTSGALLVACGGPPAAPAPTAPPAPAKPTETAKPAAPAATAPPVQAAPTAVQKPAETEKPVAAAKPDGEIGRQLIGKLEGPIVITDTAQLPKSFKEAPQLAELVKAGTLPPVAERVSLDPLVIKPVHEIGKYGGTWRRGFTGPADGWNGIRAAGHDNLLFWSWDKTQIVPNIARGWELQDGGKTLVLTLRRGMKWSDGQPFTADDILFWWEDLYQNKELLPSGWPEMSINGKPGSIQKVDEVTVRYSFPDPYFYFPSLMAGNKPAGGGQAMVRQDGQGVAGYAPAHYLKQFHPKYVSQSALDQQVADGKFDNWVNLFKFKNDWCLNPELPVVTAWKTVTPINTPTWTLERNPYSIWVDTDGNQLPYIDRVQLTLAENLEVLNLRAIAGEYDYQSRHIDIGKVPVLLENQQKGNYKLYLDPADHGSDLALTPNQNYLGDPEIARLLQEVDFRRALALGIDRDQLNEAFWLGLGTPSSVVPPDDNVYFPGPEYRTMWHVHDPTQANELLDKLGLNQKDGEGYRLRADGKGRLRLEVTAYGGQFVQATQISEMIRRHWKTIGIDMQVNEIERGLGQNRMLSGEVQFFAFPLDDSGDILQSLQTLPLQRHPWNRIGQAYGEWYASGGAQGMEPPPRMKQALEMFRKAVGVPDEERIRLGKEIWKIIAEDVWHISTVGVSAAAAGVRVAKTNLGNVPARQLNTINVRTPASSRPETFFWKS
jgi:peptide/nickel transport system substrate-binding protein